MASPIRQPKGSSNGGEFAPSTAGKTDIPTAKPVSSFSPRSQATAPENGDKLQSIIDAFQKKHGRAPVIGLDLDGTTASMVGGFRKVMADKNGITHEEALTTLGEPDKYNMWTGERAWFESKEDFLNQFQSAERDGLYRDLPAYEGAPEVINSLIANGFAVKAVTARSEDYNADTAHWLESQGIPVDEILHPGHTKHQVEGIDIFFDDAPGVISGLAEHQRKVIIFNQAWNENEPVDNEEHTRRVNGWGIEGLSQALEELL